MSLQRAAGMNINWGLLREEERKKAGGRGQRRLA
jgi:hypothetical protein